MMRPSATTSSPRPFAHCHDSSRCSTAAGSRASASMRCSVRPTTPTASPGARPKHRSDRSMSNKPAKSLGCGLVATSCASPVPTQSAVPPPSRVHEANFVPRTRDNHATTLHGEPEMDDVPVLHHVVLPLEAELARFPALRLAGVLHEVVVGDHFRADEAALDVAVD